MYLLHCIALHRLCFFDIVFFLSTLSFTFSSRSIFGKRLRIHIASHSYLYLRIGLTSVFFVMSFCIYLFFFRGLAWSKVIHCVRYLYFNDA